jgi:hypothetical protein
MMKEICKCDSCSRGWERHHSPCATCVVSLVDGEGNCRGSNWLASGLFVPEDEKRYGETSRQGIMWQGGV